MVVGLIVVTAVITAALSSQVPKPSSASASLLSSAALPSTFSSAASPHASRREHRGTPGKADGVVPDGVTVFDDAPEHRNQLPRKADATYGSDDEAARWVATAATAPAWLSRRGAEYGLCQIDKDELRPRATDRRRPRMYADPAQDPRTQQ
ncbi:hypothetical protein [Streptomyces sp. CoH27]|uniref:hypothetical protein n=1 Tax=Streptomyces sp. CoH27 TaxID=2875763 RepID=UPI001CD4D932|nr:hypothetical protein [Streptomyces sp. CoH27]